MHDHCKNPAMLDFFHKVTVQALSQSGQALTMASCS